jgi:hypothetical protein
MGRQGFDIEANIEGLEPQNPTSGRAMVARAVLALVMLQDW